MSISTIIITDLSFTLFRLSFYALPALLFAALYLLVLRVKNRKWALRKAFWLFLFLLYLLILADLTGLFFPADQRMVHRLYPDSKLFSAGSRQSRTVGTESSSNASIWIPAPACFSQNQMEFLQDPTFGNLCASPYRNVADLLQTQLGYR